jgi:hypothetical protein
MRIRMPSRLNHLIHFAGQQGRQSSYRSPFELSATPAVGEPSRSAVRPVEWALRLIPYATAQ